MTIHQLKRTFHSAALSNAQKTALLERIKVPQHSPRKRDLTAIVAFLMAFCLLLPAPIIYSVFRSGYVDIRLMDDRLYEDLDSDVSIRCLFPELEFYIDGKDIAEITLQSEQEYVCAIDFTETQDEKYWSGNKLYDDAPHLRYEKESRLSFDKDFEDYREICYRWVGYDLYQWTQEEKSRMKAGYIQLRDYDRQILEDTVTITVTDRWNNVTIKYLHIKLENEPDSIKTRLTAYVSDSPEKTLNTDPDWVTFKLADNSRTYEQMEDDADCIYGTSMEFYVDGTDIASVTIESEKEFVTAYGTLADEQLRGWQNRELKSFTLKFKKKYKEFEDVHYRWKALDLQSWAQEQDERILGGHIQLSEYPDGVLEDIVTITVTNHSGDTVIRKLHITVTNDKRKRTMITAYIE